MLKFIMSLVKRPRAILLCPGPVLLSKKVLRSVRTTHIGHREPEFSDILTQSVAMLKPIVGLSSLDKSYEIAFITGSGTAANETVLSSLGSLGPLLVISNGEFGERLHDVASLHNKQVDHLQFGWQEYIDLTQVATMLKKKKYHMVAMVHHETSTGMLNPVAEVAELAHEAGALISIDAISSMGAERIAIKKWKVDVVVGASGKALSAMPGVGILIVKSSVLKQLDGIKTHTHYLNMQKHFSFMREYSQTPNTPAVHVFISLHASLKEITKLGSTKFRRNIHKRALFAREELTRMGLQHANYGKNNSSVITCVTLPLNLNFERLASEFKSKGIVVYNGKGVLKDKVFQIGHIGALRKRDTRYALQQLEIILSKTALASVAILINPEQSSKRSHVVS